VSDTHSHFRDFVEPPQQPDGDPSAVAIAISQVGGAEEIWLYGHLITERDGARTTKVAVGIVPSEGRNNDETLFALIEVLGPVFTTLGLSVQTWGLVRSGQQREEIARCGTRLY
jgi:hypothetical protein